MRTGRLQVGVSLALAVGLAAVVHGATISVTATADSLAVDGNCTLREAVIAANTDAAVDACPGGSGTDLVVVPAGTYTLTLAGALEDAAATGDLDVTGDLVFSGAGALLTTIDGNASDRVLDVDPAGAGLTVRVSGVTLRNGRGEPQGGGVRSRGMLTLADSVVYANRASTVLITFGSARGGGIASEGSLRVERCTIASNVADASGIPRPAPAFGGGISAVGPLEVIDSTVADNRAMPTADAFAVAGISSAVQLTLVGSTVSGNLAITENGGGLDVSGSATIRNSTISGNRVSSSSGSGGGIVTRGGTLSFFNTTVADNHPNGITTFAPGPVPPTLVFRNTIVADNPLGDCAFFGSITTVGDAYNIDSDGTCGLSGTDQSGVDPRLAPLADNGGPTFTHGLIAGSPAINAGNPAAPGSGGTACEATDQRGVVRPVGPRCDVGAFEGKVPPPKPRPTTTTIPTTTTTTAAPTTTTTTTSTTTTTVYGSPSRAFLVGSADLLE
jgi:hypothetical protein